MQRLSTGARKIRSKHLLELVMTKCDFNNAVFRCASFPFQPTIYRLHVKGVVDSKLFFRYGLAIIFRLCTLISYSAWPIHLSYPLVPYPSFCVLICILLCNTYCLVVICEGSSVRTLMYFVSSPVLWSPVYLSWVLYVFLGKKVSM